MNEISHCVKIRHFKLTGKLGMLDTELEATRLYLCLGE